MNNTNNSVIAEKAKMSNQLMAFVYVNCLRRPDRVLSFLETLYNENETIHISWRLKNQYYFFELYPIYE